MSRAGRWVQRTLHLSDAQVARIRWVFVGSRGMRAGWSVLIYAGLFALAMVAAKFIVLRHVSLPKGPVAPGLAFTYEACQLAAALAATAIMGWIEGRPFWAYGLAGRAKLPLFLAGWICGLACLSLLVGVLAGAGLLAFGGLALHGAAIPAYALAWLLIFAMVGLGEEIFNRGYLLATLARGMGFWPAAAFTSVLFGASHLINHGETVAGIAQVVAAGLAWCLLLRATGSLWLGIGFHAAWDWAQSYLYGTADSGWMMQGHLLITHPLGDPTLSGGSAGPEGSVLAAPLVIAGPLAIALALRGTLAPARRRAVP